MTTAEPVVKWAGGKRKLLAQIRRRLPKQISTYYEPFVGGGAVYFSLANRKGFEHAVIADVNQELIDTYALLEAGEVQDLVDLLITYQNTPEFFDDIRALNPLDLTRLQRVARFLFLNKTCFTPGSLVLTEDESYVEIEKIKVGQRLWGGRVVLETLTQQYTGSILRIRVQSNPFTLSVTEDHPVLSIRGSGKRQDKRTIPQLAEGIELKPASELQKGDLVLLPTRGTVEKPVDWRGIWDSLSVAGPQAKKPNLDLTDELGLGRLLGYYAAEGNFRVQYGKIAGVAWTFNKDEPHYIQDVVDICQKTFGRSPSVYYEKDGEAVSIQLQSVYVARFIHNLVPGQAWAKDPTKRKTKRLSESLLQAPIALQLEILKGWFRGDGGLNSRVEMGSYDIAGTSTVIPLAHQMYRLAQRCGFRPSWWVTNPKTKSHPEGEKSAQVALCIREEISALGFDLPSMKRKSCAHRKLVESYIAVRVKEVTKIEYSGSVHNLEVDGDHLLCVDGVISHNCFNGLYRVNASGGFNVPYGTYQNPNFCDAPKLREAARALKGTTIKCLDFESVVADAKPGDAIYFDPPYLPRSETSNFTAYTDKGFGIQEHTRLARVFKEKADAGVAVLLSNSDTKIARELYRGFRISRVQSVRSINSDGEKRGPVGELLISANL